MEPTEAAGNESKALGSLVRIDEGRVQAHLDQVVRATVEETLNALLDRRQTSCAECGNTDEQEAGRTRG